MAYTDNIEGLPTEEAIRAVAELVGTASLRAVLLRCADELAPPPGSDTPCAWRPKSGEKAEGRVTITKKDGSKYTHCICRSCWCQFRYELINTDYAKAFDHREVTWSATETLTFEE